MSCSIGELKMIHYQPILNKYAYHRMLLCLIGKYGWKNIRNEAFLEDNNDVTIEHDYDKTLKEAFDMEIQSETFVSNPTLSMEGSTCK